MLLEVHRSSVDAEHRPNISAEYSAEGFGSATLQHSAKLR